MILFPFLFCLLHAEKPPIGKTVDFPPNIDPPDEKRDVVEVNIDVVDPECEVVDNPPPQKSASQKVPSPGFPQPSEEQRRKQRPASFQEDLNKLVVLGYDTKRAENALLAADFDLKKALKLLRNF